MELAISLVIGLLLGGGLVAAIFAARGREARTTLAQREAELATLREEKSALAVRCATLQSELESERALFAERQATLEAARAGFADAFKALSAAPRWKPSRRRPGANWKSASRRSANWSPR